ncbi:TPA: hypothetical protein ACGO70_000172 [Streptococcus suis]
MLTRTLRSEAGLSAHPQGQESISFGSYSPSILAYSSSVSTYE